MIDVKARAEKQPREQRVAGKVELRAASDGSTGSTLVGYASVTEAPYTMQDWLGEYEEVIRSGAFSKTLNENADVRLLLNHDGIALARTKSGTLRLREITNPKDDPQKKNQTGLWVEGDMDAESGMVRDIKSAMQRGDMDEMSIAMQVTKQTWSPDYDQRDIQEVKLFDVSLVTYAANPATSANLRNLLRASTVRSEDALAIIEAMRIPGYALTNEQRAMVTSTMEFLAGRGPVNRALDAEDVNMLTQAMAWFSAVDNIVDEAQESLSAYLGVANPDSDDVSTLSNKGYSLALARAQSQGLDL